MAEPFSIVVSAVALLATSKKVTFAIHNFIESYRGIPYSITNLRSELRTVQHAIERFEQFAQRAGDAGKDATIQDHARREITDTNQTLEELFITIDKISRGMAAGGSRRKVAMMKVKFMWSETSLNAMLLRLQARRDAITCLTTLWGK
jgi:Fic family protein